MRRPPFLVPLLVAVVGAGPLLVAPAALAAETGPVTRELTAAEAAPAAEPPAPDPAAAAKPVNPRITRIQLTEPGGGGPAARAEVSGSRLQLPRQRTAGFQTLGVTWAPGSKAGLSIAVRTRKASDGDPRQAEWSGWRSLDLSDAAAGNPGAEGGSAVRGGTDPVWVGPSDGVQARVLATGGALPADLRVELIDPGTSSFDARAGETGLARSSADRPAINSRAAWGADESRRRGTPTLMATLQAGILHHTADNNGYSKAQVPGIIRADYAYHLSRGWNDVGYNFLVDRFGRIWEGRYGGVDKAVQGAHAGGFNTDTFGVATLGNYDLVRPSAAMVESVARVMAWKLDLHHRDPIGSVRLTARGASGTTSRYPDGTTVTKKVILGHRDVGATACPGRYLYPLLASIRKRASDLQRTALLEPRASAATRTYRSGGASVSALASQSLRWSLSVRNVCSSTVLATGGGSAGARKRFTATWNGRTSSGKWARPGRYALTLTATNGNGSARAVTTTVLVVPPAQPAPAAQAFSTGAGTFVPVDPVTIVDTRSGDAPLGPGGRVDLPVLGRGGVPLTGVSSVVVEAVSVCQSQPTALTVGPAGQPGWATQAVHVPVPRTRSATVVVPVSADGRISLRNDQGVSDVVAEVIGYHTTAAGGAGLVGGGHRTLYDSRTGGGPLPGGPSGSTRTIPVPASFGVQPAGQAGQLVDVSVFSPAGPGMLEVFGGSSTTGTAARLHYAAGPTHDERLFARVVDGKITIRVTGAAVQFALDSVGAFSRAGGAALTAVSPARLVDTRTSGNGFLAKGGYRTVQVAGARGVPADAKYALVNLVGLTPQANTRLVLRANGGATPAGYDLYVGKGDVRANLALVPIGAAGGIQVGTRDAPSKIVVDLVGWYR